MMFQKIVLPSSQSVCSPRRSANTDFSCIC